MDRRAWTAWAALALAGAASAQDPDSDRDGLSDFHEVHKYFTDPKKADSDGDKVPDGDWDERREFAYTVRAVMHVMAPFDLASMSDDYQDARALDLRGDLLEFEVVVYPFNTVAAAIEPRRDWRREYAAAMKADLAPGVTTNWDAAMQRELAAALAKDGIDLAQLDDREAVERASKWLMQRAQFEDSFTTFAVEFERGVPRVAAGGERAVEAELARRGRTFDEQLQRELFGRGMFEHRIRGSCTSSAIYLATGLKAAGIPARTIVCVPIVDANDEREVGWIGERIAHNGVRAALERSTAALKGAWASHTFNEVYVGGRWRRLNYDRLGQNVLDADLLGLMVHVHTFRDHADAGLAAWGRRESHPLHAALFGGPNPYSCVSLSDRFGAHAEVENPAVDEGYTALTVSRLYWYADGTVKMRLDDPDTAGHLLVHVEEGEPGDDPGDFSRWYEKVDKRFVLRAGGRDDVPVRADRGYWIDVDADVKEFYLRIEADDLARMAFDVRYELAWLGSDPKWRWIVQDGVSIVRKRR